MRPAAQVNERSVLVDAQRRRGIRCFAVLVAPQFQDIIDQLQLVRLAGKQSAGLFFRYFAVFKGLTLRDDLLHACFDRLEVLWRQRPR